jgi:AraC-like DNA-binding protein
MKEPTVNVEFKNKQNPNAQFDLVKLESLLSRKGLNHSPLQIHIAGFYILLFIEGGKGQHRVDFKDYSYSKGSIITIRKDQLHQFYKSPTVKGLMLLFTNDFLISYLENTEAKKAFQLFNELLGDPKIQLTDKEYTEIQQLVQRINNEYFGINDSYSLGIIRSELQILITKLYRLKSNRKQIIFNKKYLAEFVTLQELVEDKVTETTKVKDYADIMGKSTKTLNNITQSIVNKSAKDFINEICIKQIKRLLLNTSHSIKEISYLSGFEETTNFYKYFKQHIQTTPEKFRQENS